MRTRNTHLESFTPIPDEGSNYCVVLVVAKGEHLVNGFVLEHVEDGG